MYMDGDNLENLEPGNNIIFKNAKVDVEKIFPLAKLKHG